MLGVKLLFLLCVYGVVADTGEKDDRRFDVAFEWKFVNFTWESSEQIKKFKYDPRKDTC